MMHYAPLLSMTHAGCYRTGGAVLPRVSVCAAVGSRTTREPHDEPHVAAHDRRTALQTARCAIMAAEPRPRVRPLRLATLGGPHADRHTAPLCRVAPAPSPGGRVDAGSPGRARGSE